MGKNDFRFWGTVAKDGGSIRGVQLADSAEMAETLLMADWTPRLKALYDVKPVTVTVDEFPASGIIPRDTREDGSGLLSK